jgi:nitrogen fixation-related uncharacterized protein
MRRDGKGNEEFILKVKRDTAGMREVYFSAKGRLAVAVISVVVILGFLGIGGYFWADGNRQRESKQIPAERSFPEMNYRVRYTIKE